MDTANIRSNIKIHCDYSELKAIFYDCDISNIEIIPNSYFNTQPNAIVFLDRNAWEYFYESFKKNIEEFDRIQSMWKDNNNLVVFWKCHFEPLGYIVDKDFILKKWNFKHITITDSEMFKNEDGFYFNHFSNLIHMIGCDKNGLYECLEDTIVHSNSKEYDYYFSFFTPRIQKIHFLNRMIDEGIANTSLIRMNKPFYDNEQILTNKENLKWIKPSIKTFYDNTTIFRKFDEYRPYVKFNNFNIKSDETHSSLYIKQMEYDKAYIDLNAETHCIFRIPPGNTEKVYKSLFTEKPFICIGAQKVYEELEKIGVTTYVSKFGLEILRDTNEPIEHIDAIIEFQKNNINNIQSLFIELEEIRKNNRKIFLDNYKKITREVYDFVMSYYGKLIES
jgi:hypothetical protein